VCAPEAIEGQPFSCAAVGASKVRSNHVLVAGPKTSRAPTEAA
jgi:hypothetical protein